MMDRSSDPADFDDMELTLLEARVQTLQRKGTDAAFTLLGSELRPYLRDPASSTLPTSLKDVLEDPTFHGDGSPETFRSSASDDRIGKRFWDVFGAQLRKSLCTPDGELHKLLVSEGKTTTKALITALVVTLGAGTAFAGVICGLAAIILEIGLRSFCEWTEAPAT